MIRMVYISSAVRLMTDAELVSLLRQCRANNEKAGITGMLLYKGGNFMQALEGPEEDVDRLQRRIEADPRHTGIITLLKSPLEQRRFTGWSMGFRNVDTLDDADRDAFSPFLREPFTTQAFGGEPDKALKLLLSFKKSMR